MPPRHQRQSAYVSGRARTRIDSARASGARCVYWGNPETAASVSGTQQPGNTTARPPAAARPRPAGAAVACVARVMRRHRPDVPPVRSGAARCSTGPVWCGPMFHRSAPDRGRSGPGPAPGGERADAVSRSSLMPEMVNRHRRWHERSQADRDSMVSRRTQPFQAWDAARGRTTSAQRPHGRAFHAASKVPQPHPHLLAHLFQMNGFTWGVFGESAGINRHGGGDGRALR
jgi:hypothetical protein